MVLVHDAELSIATVVASALRPAVREGTGAPLGLRGGFRGGFGSVGHATAWVGYHDLLSIAAAPTWLLFCFHSAGRETAARRALVDGPRTLATAVLAPGSSPAAAIWLPLEGPRRLRLAELTGP
jgi:hypothetical protein